MPSGFRAPTSASVVVSACEILSKLEVLYRDGDNLSPRRHADQHWLGLLGYASPGALAGGRSGELSTLLSGEPVASPNTESLGSLHPTYAGGQVGDQGGRS